MPLNAGALASALQDLFAGHPQFPANTTEAGKKWAAAYRQYASAALAGATAPTAALLAAAESKLAAAITAGFSAAAAAGPAGAAVLPAALDLAFVAFWLTPPVVFAPPAPAPPTIAGVVTVAPAGALSGLLTTAFAAGLLPGATPASQAKAVAGALDLWTKTVMVVNTPVTPPGPPLPPAPLA